ncbi:UNVERIFIED_CONTAM: hypothetical protein GTU68_063655 [Idotea baltica]|nr:hypothetical protein [Idotea baltica]
MKQGPNILITGTPGTGKSTLAQLLGEHSGLQHINVSDVAKENNCFDGYDQVRDCPILDEEKVLDELEDPIEEGGTIIEYHSCDFFPERFFDIIFVLRSDNTILYDRLHSRGYTGKKLSDNMECEIMAVIRDEAKESYDEHLVHELPSNTPEDLEDNLQRILDWIKAWNRDNGITA